MAGRFELYQDKAGKERAPENLFRALIGCFASVSNFQSCVLWASIQ